MAIEKKTNILIVGSGGREEALKWKLSHSPRISNIFVAPGNGGTSPRGENVAIGINELDRLATFAADNNALTIVGSEEPLAKGIVNLFQEEGLPIFGPTKEAAVVESSKIEAVKLFQKLNIPHPFSYIPDNGDHGLALAEIIPFPYVVKGDALAGGKDVFVPETRAEGIEVVQSFVKQGKRFLFQKREYGPEVSLMAFTDGTVVVPLLPAQDHKRRFENDKGPNTGGMGAYAPVPKRVYSETTHKQVYDDILVPLVHGLRERGTPFKGVLYAGLMLTQEGPKVIEFNCRLGDPETQPLMMLLKSDLFVAINATIRETLEPEHVEFKQGAAVIAVMVSNGYPGSYETGYPVSGLDAAESSEFFEVFHAGTRRDTTGQILTSGGRVLGPTAYSPKGLSDARKNMYAKMALLGFAHEDHRLDIAAPALKNY